MMAIDQPIRLKADDNAVQGVFVQPYFIVVFDSGVFYTSMPL